jgi:hypothetical protein
VRKKLEAAVITREIHSHVWARVKEIPSRTSASSRPAGCRSPAAIRIAMSDARLAAKLAASAANAHVVPTAAMRMPPRAGPSRFSANVVDVDRRAFAWSRSSEGTTSG